MSASRKERFYLAMGELVAAVDHWHKLLHDPYKAPELRVGLPPTVASAAWNLGIAWHIMVEEETAECPVERATGRPS